MLNKIKKNLIQNLMLSLTLTSLTVTGLALSQTALASSREDNHYDDSDYRNRDKTFYYWKLSGARVDIGRSSTFIPVMGFGQRSQTKDYAIDFSVAWGNKYRETDIYSYSQHRYIGIKKTKTSYLTFPRFTFSAFTHPQEKSSFFYGGGLSWGYIRNDESKFSGIFGELLVGYELNRREHFKPVIEISAVQPLLAQSRRGEIPGITWMTSLSFVF